MPKNLGLYNNNLSVPRKQDVDDVQNELKQLTIGVDTHIGDTSNPHQVTKAQVGLNNVANVLQYSADNPPPYPVTSVNGDSGAVVLGASDVGAVPTTRTVNGKSLSSNITLTASDVGLGNVDNVQQYSSSNPPPYPVTSVNSKTGNVALSASDVGAIPKQSGTTGQLLGFVSTNTIGPLDASSVISTIYNTQYSGSINSSGWVSAGSLYYTTKYITGMTTNQNVLVFPNWTSNEEKERENWNNLTDVDSYNGYVRFWSTKRFTTSVRYTLLYNK